MLYLKLYTLKGISFEEIYNIFFLILNSISVKQSLYVTKYKNHLTLFCSFGCCILPFTEQIGMAEFAFLINYFEVH